MAIVASPDANKRYMLALTANTDLKVAATINAGNEITKVIRIKRVMIRIIGLLENMVLCLGD